MGVQATNPVALVSTGVPPAVPNIASAEDIGDIATNSPITVYTFTANGRVWGVNLSGSAAASSSYSAGDTRVYFTAQADGTITLAVIEQVLNTAGQVLSDSVFVPFNGLPMAAGTPLELVINGGVSPSNTNIVGSVIFFYSVP